MTADERIFNKREKREQERENKMKKCHEGIISWTSVSWVFVFKSNCKMYFLLWIMGKKLKSPCYRGKSLP